MCVCTCVEMSESVFVCVCLNVCTCLEVCLYIYRQQVPIRLRLAVTLLWQQGQDWLVVVDKGARRQVADRTPPPHAERWV